MWQQILIDFITKFIAACIVMILHETIKTKVYLILNKNRLSSQVRRYYKFSEYIDPIGLLLYISCNAGFSKPIMFLLKDKKTSMNLGVFGILSQLSMFFLFCGIARIMINTSWLQISGTSMLSYLNYFLNSLVFRLALFSFTGLMVNLFPLTLFDMGLIIAGKSIGNFINVLKLDLFVKTLVIISICIGLIYEFSYGLTELIIFY